MGAARRCESIPGRFSFLGLFRTEDCREPKRGRQGGSFTELPN